MLCSTQWFFKSVPKVVSQITYCVLCIYTHARTHTHSHTFHSEFEFRITVKCQNFTYWWCLLLLVSLSSAQCTSPKHGTDASTELRDLVWISLQLHSRSIPCSFSIFPWVRYSLYAVVFLWYCINHIIKHLWGFHFVSNLVKWLQNYLRKKRLENYTWSFYKQFTTGTFVSTYLVKQGLKFEDVFGVHKHHRGVDGILQRLAEPQEVHESLARGV